MYMKNKNLIGISGKIGSGKDTAAVLVNQIIEELPGYYGPCATPKFEIKKFASTLKDIVCLLIGCAREQLEDQAFKNKELPDCWDIIIDESFGMPASDKPWPVQKMTPRMLLQLMGTECGRNIIHENIWVNATFAAFTLESRWVITDMRFPNELKAIKSRGGITIRINRPDTIRMDHESETALDSAEFDYVITNEGTLDDLKMKIKAILQAEGII